MIGLNELLAVAGVLVTLLVIVAMILVTPHGAVRARRAQPDPIPGAAPSSPAAAPGATTTPQPTQTGTVPNPTTR